MNNNFIQDKSNKPSAESTQKVNSVSTHRDQLKSSGNLKQIVMVLGVSVLVTSAIFAVMIVQRQRSTDIVAPTAPVSMPSASDESCKQTGNYVVVKVAPPLPGDAVHEGAREAEATPTTTPKPTPTPTPIIERRPVREGRPVTDPKNPAVPSSPKPSGGSKSKTGTPFGQPSAY